MSILIFKLIDPSNEPQFSFQLSDKYYGKSRAVGRAYRNRIPGGARQVYVGRWGVKKTYREGASFPDF